MQYILTLTKDNNVFDNFPHDFCFCLKITSDGKSTLNKCNNFLIIAFFCQHIAHLSLYFTINSLYIIIVCIVHFIGAQFASELSLGLTI